jgi:hypothetical protein
MQLGREQMNMSDSLNSRATQARAEKLAADAKAQVAHERAKELKRQRELRKLQDIPSAQMAREAAKSWFATMGVDPVESQVTKVEHGRRSYNDEGYIEVYAEWVSTFLAWQLEGHCYYGDYREYSILDESRCETSSFTVEIAIRNQKGKIARRQADTLAELGVALEEENSSDDRPTGLT